MAIIEVYVGSTGQIVRVKCRTKDRRDAVLKLARKAARSLGAGTGSGTVRLRRKAEEASPVDSLRLSRAVVAEMVLVAEDPAGARRVVGPDELPVELLMNATNNVRRLRLLTPAQMLEAGAIANPSEPSPVTLGEGSDDESDTSASSSRTSSAGMAVSPARSSPLHSYPSLSAIDSSRPSLSDSQPMSPALARVRPDTPVHHLARTSSSPAPITTHKPLPDNVKLVALNGQVSSATAASSSFSLDGSNAWIFTVPPAYTFELEREALELVSHSHAIDLQRSMGIDAVLQRASSSGAVPPPVNRAAKPVRPEKKAAVSAKVPPKKPGGLLGLW